MSTRFDLTGHRIIVTGSSQGLGRGLALAAMEAGASVVGIARSESGLQETKELAVDLPGRFEGVAADLTARNDLGDLIDRLWADGPINDIIHAAGVQARRPAIDITPEDWDRVTAIQMDTPFFLSTNLARRQHAEGVHGGHIFIGSLTSWIGRPNVAPYTASKSAILGLTRSLALEWASLGIRVNAICPGYFHTALNNDFLSDPANRDQILSRIPMKRFGVADDLAGAAIFLLSGAANYVTGQTINVDGGWLAS